MEEKAVALSGLSVGYGGKVIVDNINVDFPKGKMICILGANGAGKTTVLKTISRIIPKLNGTVQIGGKPLHKIRTVDLAQEMAVVLTQKIDISNLTGMQVASMGRYPHTGFFCKLSGKDIATVEKYMELCSAADLKDRYFYEMSDGEKQKIMLVRGLAQDADIIMLDNMSDADMRAAVQLIAGRAQTECSGNVTKENIARLKDIGVDFVSSGALTHSAPILDLSMKHLRPLDKEEA